MAKPSCLTFVLAFLCIVPLARADPARFDLAGPKVDIRVTRAGKALPIASVPNLQGGDRIWLRPDLPSTQSVRYLLVVAFLRGTTNPPPDNWFTRIETWNKKVREEGTEVTVPTEAEQALVFLAPVTGGDFTTLRSAVRGRPGVFVRASQDLNEAGFEQGRIEKYLAAIRTVPPGDAKGLVDHSNLLARTLALRPNPDCFKRDPEQQVTCLTQTGSQTLLDDGHGQTVVAALTTGPSSDLISAASYTQMAGGGVYSAYVGAVVDLARLLGGLHTAQYQYIPAIALPQDESLNLRLNTPPSFHNPKSVIVIGLPAIQKSATPPLRSADVQHVTCLLQPNAALPLEGAPLVFSTAFAHDLTLHLTGSQDAVQDLPLAADAYQGGLVIDRTPSRRPLPNPRPSPASSVPPSSASSEPVTTATIHGFWGFDSFEGPTVAVQTSPGEKWTVLSGEPLIAGRDDHLVLHSTGNACLQAITFDSAGGASLKVATKPVSGTGARSDIDVALPLASASPGSLQLSIHQYGVAAPTLLAIRSYSNPARVEAVRLHQGDRTAMLTGDHLEDVRELILNDLHFTPHEKPSSEGLALSVPDTTPISSLHAGEKLPGHVALADGRSLDLTVTVAAARPALTLRSKSTPRDDSALIRLLSKDVLRVDQPLTLILRGEASIPRNEAVEVSTADTNPTDALSVKLTFGSGALVLQDARTIRVTFEPLKALGPSIFGSLRLRAIDPAIGDGDWIPLGTFVRLPNITSFTCPAEAARPCLLTGTGLFLIDQIGTDQSFTAPTSVPEDFSDATLQVPRPMSGVLYLRLRDASSATAILSLPTQQDPTRATTGTRPTNAKE